MPKFRVPERHKGDGQTNQQEHGEKKNVPQIPAERVSRPFKKPKHWPEEKPSCVMEEHQNMTRQVHLKRGYVDGPVERFRDRQ
jgi:hypothetical protein